MADSAKLDTGQSAEKSPVSEAKNKKDETNEKIKTDNQENVLNEDGDVNAKVESTDPNTMTESAISRENEKINDTDQTNNSEKKTSKTVTKEGKENKKKTNKKEKKTDAKKEDVPAEVRYVQSHYKTHAKSTLPHILTEYGLEDRDHSTTKQKEKKKKKSFVEQTDEVDTGSQPRKKGGNEFEKIFGGRPTDSYYMEYIDFLEQKVVQQRQKAQKEKEEAEKLRALQEEAESTGFENKAPSEVSELPDVQRKHHFVRRLERVEMKHDDSFLRNLPKTDIARIIALQDKMKKEGKLKNQYDVDKFWEDIRKPKVFYEQFKVNKKDVGHEHLHLNSNTNGQHEEQDLGPRGLSHISEVSKAGESWAITQKFQSQHSTSPKSASSERRKDSAQTSRDAASELEKRCPKLEMPPLACFSLKLGDKPPDPDTITKKLMLKAREKSRKKFQRKLNKMYQMAMTNTAAANRILAQHGDLTDILEGAALRDVLAVFDEPYPTLEEYYRDFLDPSHAMVERSEDRVSQYSQSGAGTKPSSAASTRYSSAGSRKLTPITDTASRPGSLSRRKKKTPEMIEYPAPLPLSYNEVYTREKTLEPKCVSTLWTNYMQAGKSAFAPS